MKTIRISLVRAISIAALSGIAAQGQIVYDYSWSSFNGGSSLPIPDHNATGVSDVRTIALDPSRSILSVSVNFQATGNFNGDLYLTLVHSGGFATLLNRPGRDTGEPWGYDDSGFHVTFKDGASYGDIHNYRLVLTPDDGAPLTGTWQPDGRLVDPSGSLSSSARTAFLNSFTGLSANGDWTLFAADLSTGGQTQILDWGLSVTVVPEPPGTLIVTGFALLSGALIFRKRRFSIRRTNPQQTK